MLFQTRHHLELEAESRKWEIHSLNHDVVAVPEGYKRLGLLARFIYAGEALESDGELTVLFPDVNYHSARNYVESVWAKDGILRVQNDLESYKEMMVDSVSIPTRGLRRLHWMTVFEQV